MPPTPHATYQQMDVYSMTPPKRVVALYTHLLSNLRQARRFLSLGDVENRQAKLFKAMDATEILLSALDEERGGPIARPLTSLYVYFLQQIIHIDMRADLEALDRLIAMVETLHRTWTEAAVLVERKEQVPA